MESNGPKVMAVSNRHCWKVPYRAVIEPSLPEAQAKKSGKFSWWQHQIGAEIMELIEDSIRI